MKSFGFVCLAGAAQALVPQPASKSLMVRDAPPSKVATMTAGSPESPMPCVVNFLADAPAVVISCSLTTPQGPAQPTVTSAPGGIAERDVAHPPSGPGYEFLHVSANIDIDFVKSRCPTCYNGTAGRNYTQSYGVNLTGTATANQTAGPAMKTTMASLSKPMSTSGSSTEEMDPSSATSSSSSSQKSSSSVSSSTSISSTEEAEASRADPTSTSSQQTSTKTSSTRSFKAPVTLQSSSSSTTETSLGVGFLNPTPSGVSSTIPTSNPPPLTLTPNPTITFQDLPRTSTRDPQTELTSSEASSEPTSSSSTASSSVATSSSKSPRSRQKAQSTNKSTSSQSTTSTTPSAEIESTASVAEDPQSTTSSAEAESTTSVADDPQATNMTTDSMGFTWSIGEPKSTKPASAQATGEKMASSATTSSYGYPASSKEPHYIPWDCDEKDPACTILKA